MIEAVGALQKDERLDTTHVTPDLIDYVVHKIVREVKPQKIILFGSHARGEAKDDSDLDLFIVHDGTETNRFLRRKIDGLLWGRRFGIDLMVRTPQEVALNVADHNPFYTRDILTEGRVLYERPRASAG